MSASGSGSDRQVRNLSIMGIVFAAIGFTAIGLGWNGMARIAFADGQLPYLLSGGAAGLGLIVFGSALLVIGRFRGERLKADARMEELIKATGRVGTAIATTQGSENGLVVAGRSTYHRPDCRLVEGKDLEKVTVGIASSAGLSACRVCSPATVDAAEGAEAASEERGAKAGSGRPKRGAKASGRSSKRGAKKGSTKRRSPARRS